MIAKSFFINEAVQKWAGKEGGERKANHLCLFSSLRFAVDCSVTYGLPVAYENLWYCFCTQLDNNTEGGKGEVSLGDISLFRLVEVKAPALSP